MTVELLLDEHPGPAPLALALERGWATLPLPTRAVPRLTAATARAWPEALLLIPVAEYALLQETHLIVPGLACGGWHRAAAALIADRRFDLISAPRVELGDASRTTECLARATLAKFYGITPARWTRHGVTTPAPIPSAEPGHEATDDAPGPLPRVVDGLAALRALDAPDDLTVADLGKAWFILTGLPAVSHLLLAPRALVAAEPDRLRDLTAALPIALAAVHQRRRELRRDLSQRDGLSRDFLSAFSNDRFWTLHEDARKAVARLLERGGPGTGLPAVANLALLPD